MHLLLLPLLLLLVACGEAGESADKAPPALESCIEDADCPEGLVCEDAVCVAGDGLPPEVELPASTFLPPAATDTYLWILSPDDATVTAIHTATSDLRSFSVAAEPLALAAIPGEDAVLVLSREGRALSRIAFEDGVGRVRRHRLDRRLSALDLSPDGKWAVLWNPDGAPLDAGLEGLVVMVEVASLAEEAPTIHERMAGRRPAALFFREAAGVATDLTVLSKEELTLFDLARLDEEDAREHLPLPAPLGEPTTRQAAATEDGAHLLLGSITSPDLLAVRVEDRSLHPLTLSGPPSDLRIRAGTALAVLREAGLVAHFPFPEVLDDPSGILETEVTLSWEGCGDEGCSASPGQARFSSEGDEVFLFTTASPALVFATLDLADGSWTLSPPLRKPIRALAPAPRGDRLVVIHQAIESQRADAYEKWVDESEGYGIVDLASGASQLRLTERIPPLGVVYAAGERFAGVLLRDEKTSLFQVDAVDLQTLVPRSLDLPSAPVAAGPLPREGTIWVLQKHPLGRVSFVDLAEAQVETVTGFAFQGRVN